MSDILLLKSAENKRVAQFAESETHFNVAVSRNYYYLFLLIVNFVKTKSPSFETPRGVGSHASTLTEFSRQLNIRPSELRHFNTMLVNLSQIRNKYEYSPTEYLDSLLDYNKNFKKIYNDACNKIKEKEPSFFN